MKNFRYYKQLNAMDCGPTCLRMAARIHGKHFTAESIRQMAGYSKQGVSLLGLSQTAEKIGFKTRGVRIQCERLKEIPLPAILHWDHKHFVVLIDVKAKKFKVADPSTGVISHTKSEFLRRWESSKDNDGKSAGIALLLEPTPAFYQQEGHKESSRGWSFVINYLAPSKWKLIQVFIALIVSSVLSMIVPFLTQSVVDKGINTENVQFVAIILFAQAMLTFSQTIIGVIRSRLLLRISNILNMQILSDFWIKLMRLPVSYFDTHHTGDTLQRINDHRMIQSFLTGTAITTLFSVFSFIVYSTVLVVYSVDLFFCLCIGSLVYLGWVQIFLRLRRKLNYENFFLAAKEKTATLQMIQGMQEIRLNNADRQKRWEWENIQASVFNLSFKGLNYNQLQNAGATLIHSFQGIAISFISAKLVIDGQLTFGAMLAVQYIVGQLTGPVQQWVNFIQSAQDAKISMERLNDIHQLSDEEPRDKRYILKLPDDKSIIIKDLTFTYPGSQSEPVLHGIQLVIPENKVTAIVGGSGSGKTTLIKLLLKVYDQYNGEIRIGSKGLDREVAVNFRSISHNYWRSVCGAVLQDGYIFNESILANVAVGDDEIDYKRLEESCKIANIHTFIESLPNGYYTRLGADGTGLSQGQKQRILIARSVYKNPEYLFFDEATNALDAHNESEIVNGLNKFFNGRTVVVVAHRLSTVRNADKIAVLDHGKIVEEGTHEELTMAKGKYFELVRSQLEMES